MLLGSSLVNEANNAAVIPWSSQMLSSQLHGRVKPLPERERAIGQRLLAELRPSDLIVVRGWHWHLHLERLFAQEVQVLSSQVSACARAELHVQRLGQPIPWHFIWHHKGSAIDLGKRIVPSDCGPGLRLLISVHNHYHGQGERPHGKHQVSVANGEARLEEQSEFLVHHALGALLLGTLDLLQLHIAETHRQLLGGFVVLHVASVVDNLTTRVLRAFVGLLSVLRLDLGHNGYLH